MAKAVVMDNAVEVSLYGGRWLECKGQPGLMTGRSCLDDRWLTATSVHLKRQVRP